MVKKKCFAKLKYAGCAMAAGPSPRENLMEEGMGVPARGGRRESWAPPDVLCSSHLASVYGVPISTRARSPGRRRTSFRPPLPHRPHLRVRVGAGLKSFPAGVGVNSRGDAEITLQHHQPTRHQPIATQGRISISVPAPRSYPASAGLRHHAASSSLRVAGRFHLRRVDHWHHEPFASVVSPEL